MYSWDDDVLSCCQVGGEFVDVVQHGSDILVFGTDYEQVRWAAIEALACDDTVTRQLRSLAWSGREMREPADYSDAALPSTNARAAMVCARIKLRENIARRSNGFGEFDTCAAGHAWPHGADHCLKCANVSQRRSQRKYPAKNRARSAVKYAIRKGLLTRQPCEQCGAPKAEAHHDDYSRPLAVRWLCKTHHPAAHARGPLASSAEKIAANPPKWFTGKDVAA